MIEFSQYYMQRQYELGTIDCFKLVYDYRQWIKKPLPDSFGDVSISNYADLYRDNPRKAKSIMLRYIRKHLTQIPPYKTFCGDIVYIQLGGNKALGINVGNGLVMVANEVLGVTMAKLENYKILRAFR